MFSRTSLTRRTFLKVSFTAGGGLLIGSYLEGCTMPQPSPTTAPTQAPTPVPTSTVVPEPPFEPNLFVRIDADGSVTLTIHRSEMGQGVRTALAMILAEELEADWARVRVEQAPANDQMGSQLTGGSLSIAEHYSPLRQAGAKARAILVAAAAQTWGVTSQECQAEQGTVVHTATDKRLSYGELVTAAKQVQRVPAARLKDPNEFRLIGTSVPRVDDPAIVSGQAIYGLDVRLPGMLFATLARCPVPGGALADFDATQAETLPGVRAVVEVPAGVAVIAENTWAAIQGRAALNLTWNEGVKAELSSESIRQRLIEIMQQAIAQEAPASALSIEAVYETPYLAHAPMEPVNCVADVRSDHCDIWAPTQNPQDVQSFVQSRINVPTDVHVTLAGGGFGRRLEVDYAIEAAQVSQAVGAPVQVVWTREDDIQHDFYRQPTYHWLRASWDDAGALESWRRYVVGPGFHGIVYHDGVEVLDEGLAVPYDIPGRYSRSLLANIALPTGPWRAVGSGPNAFANECFFDEVATTLNKDPVELRLALLPESNPLRSVVELAATQAGWGTALAEGHGRGVACHAYHDTAVAMVAEVSLQAGVVRAHRVVCAIDCGTVIHPDMVVQQMEGGVVFGLTSLFKGEITFEQGRVQQSNFHDYPLLRIDEMPQVEVYIVPSTRAPHGVGETGVPPIVPAVVNAIFAATGRRIRRIPIRAEDLQA